MKHYYISKTGQALPIPKAPKSAKADLFITFTVLFGLWLGYTFLILFANA